MKKILLSSLCMLLLTFSAQADDKSDVLSKFDSYVKAANSYSSNLPDFYLNNAKIIRVVNKKQGGQKSVIIPFDRYVKELNTNAKLASVVGYKNSYVNRNITKIDNNTYKITATRIPRNDKTGLPSYFVFTKLNDTWKIKEESMTTNVQAFLNAR